MTLYVYYSNADLQMAHDERIEKLVGGTLIGAGTNMCSMERDMSFEVTPLQAEASIARLKKMGIPGLRWEVRE